MARKVLEIDVDSDAAKAAQAFDAVGDSALAMSTDIDKASRVADEAGSRLDKAAAGADNLDSKSAAATGSLGALSSGFELVGLDQYATGLQSAAMATDFFSGIGQGLNLVLETQAFQSIKNTALKAKDIVVTGVLTAATTAQTAAQWALNVALNANPIALILIAIVALVAGFILLYKKSETVREVTDKVFHAIVGYVKLVTLPTRFLISQIVELTGWIKDSLPSAWSAATGVVTNLTGSITGKVSDLLGKAGDLRDYVRDKIPEAFSWAKDEAVESVKTITSPITALIDFVQDLIDKIANIHWPDPPGWVKDVGGVIGGIFGLTGSTDTPDDFPELPPPPGSGGQRIVKIYVSGAIDPIGTARTIRDVLQREAGWSGTVVET